MADTLNFKKLLDMSEKLRGHRAMRIISGAPFVPTDEAKQFDDGLACSVMFLGAKVVEALVREAAPMSEPDVGTLRFTGIEIEPWGTRPDHSRIAARIVGRMLVAEPAASHQENR